MEHQQQYVGIDLHRRRSVIVRMTEDGEVLECVRIANDPVALSLELAKAGPDPEVALEATYGWYWAADLLESDGARVHLVHPLGLHWDARRVKNDERDATELAHRLRRDDLPEAWIAPAEVRELRELIRYRAKLAALRTSAKAQIQAVMAKLGILPTLSDMFSAAGQVLLDGMPFEGPYALRVDSLRGLLERYEHELVLVERELHGRLVDHKGYTAIQALNGVGRITAAIFVAEIGDVTRFPDARHLCSWAGLTPSHRESDQKVHRGHITKQGSTLVRWAAIEAVARYHGGAPIAPAFMRIQKRRGTMIARVAAARKLLTLVLYGLRTARSAAWSGRPVEHGSDTAKARARRSPWPPSGEAVELSAARLAVAGTHHAPRTVGTKEWPAAEPHGLSRPALGANGEVTAVSTHNEATRNPWRGSIPIVAGDNLRPGPSRLPPWGGPDGPALTAPSPHPAAHFSRGAQRARPHSHRARRSAKESAFDFVEDC